MGQRKVFPECKLASTDPRPTAETGLQAILLVNGQLTVYTNGLATTGTEDGGAGVIVTFGEPADPTVLHRSHLRGAAFTLSFAEEATAMHVSLEWATANHPVNSLTIYTDSQSPLNAIEHRYPVTHHLRSHFNARPGPTTLRWVPGHKEISSKKLADTEAKMAATVVSDPPRTIFHAS